MSLVRDGGDMKVGDLVKLSAIEEIKLTKDVGCFPEEWSDWEYGIIVEVCSNHGNPPFYQVHWSPANEVCEESYHSIVSINEDENW